MALYSMAGYMSRAGNYPPYIAGGCSHSEKDAWPRAEGELVQQCGLRCANRRQTEAGWKSPVSVGGTLWPPEELVVACSAM